MDGKDALRRLRELLDEEATGVWVDTRTSYDYLWMAVKEFVRLTRFYTGEQKIETSTDIENYTLDADFMGLFLKDTSNRFFINYNNAAQDYNLTFKDYEDIIVNPYTKVYDLKQGTLTYPTNKFRDTGQDFTDYDATSSSDCAYKITVVQIDGTARWAYIGTCPDTTNSTDYINVYKNVTLANPGWNGDAACTPDYYEVQNISTSTVPDHFSIKNKESLYAQISGNASSNGAATAGECILQDGSAQFYSDDNVSPGDHIHNTTDESTGIVTEVLSDKRIKTALFGGANNDWTTNDAYVIQPMGRSELILDPPPSVNNHLVTVKYIKMPDPVYSDYRTYNLPQPAMEAIICYAAWLYKYRDGEPNFGDALYIIFRRMVVDFMSAFKPFIKKKSIKVNLKKRD